MPSWHSSIGYTHYSHKPSTPPGRSTSSIVELTDRNWLRGDCRSPLQMKRQLSGLSTVKYLRFSYPHSPVVALAEPSINSNCDVSPAAQSR
jgi:hypothetical protein